jgi:hypothetical protein
MLLVFRVPPLVVRVVTLHRPQTESIIITPTRSTVITPSADVSNKGRAMAQAVSRRPLTA